MSNTKNYLMSLQERPEYRDGYEAKKNGGRFSHPWPAFSPEAKAFRLGWDEAHDELMSKPGEP